MKTKMAARLSWSFFMKTCNLLRRSGRSVLEAITVTRPQADTEELLQRAQDGEEAARRQLLTRHQARLRQMVAVRLDRRVAARLDPSDVVQEALMEAHGKLSDYLRSR